MTQILICLAMVLVGFGLFQRPSVSARKIGVLCFWCATGLGVYFLSGEIWLGVAALLAWILLPVSEIVMMLRQLRMPKDRCFRDATPPLEEFPGLRALTQEFEALGFQRADDCDLTPALHEQYYRLFLHPEKQSFGAIGFVSQGGVGFHFTAFFSEEKSGRLWVTWDYPLTYGLKMPPDIALHRVFDSDTVQEVWEEHQAFLEINERKPEELLPAESPRGIRDLMARSLSRQVEYNLSVGILLPEAPATEGLRYSWRGVWYVTRQVVQDLVRL